MNRFIAVVLLLLLSTTVSAQTTIISQEVRSGQINEIVLTPQDTAIQTVSLWMLSSGNETLPVKVSLQGPSGLKATLKARQVARQSMVATALASETGWWNLPKGTKTLAASSSPPALPAETSICDYMTEEEIADLIAFYTYLLGRPVTREEVCGGFNGDPGDPDNPDDPGDPAGLAEFTSILLKDGCRAKRRSFYLIKLDLSLNQVDRSQQENITIQAAITARRYSGKRRASLKPVSEGRYAPAPLMLMEALGGGFFFGGVSEKMYINKWSKGRPKKNRKVNTPQYVYYRDMRLAEGLIGSHLRGGKATATLSNDITGYSVCLRLERRRQKWNGYP